MVGKLIPDFFPKIFGPAQNQPLDADAVKAAFAALAREVGGGRTPGRGRRRLHPDRGREHGERDQEDLGAARLRRHPLCAQLLRRRRRPARLPRRRCARHDQGADPSVLVAAVGLWHGARRHPRDAPAGARGGFRSMPRCGRSKRVGRQARRGRQARADPARACPRDRSRYGCARISATPAPTRRWSSRPARSPR